MGSRRPLSPRMIPVVALLLVHLIALVLMLLLPQGIWPVTLVGGRLRIPSGIIHAQIAVLAAWAAWSQMTVALRVPLALLGSLLAGFVLLAAFPGPRYFRMETIVVTLATALLLSVLVQGMCWGARIFGIEWQDADRGEIPRKRTVQFHLWELLALMAAIAVLLGSLRLVWPSDATFDWQSVSEDNIILSSILLLGNLLLANTVITVYHVRRGWLTNLAITLGIAALITLLEYFSVLRLARVRSIFMFLWMNGLYLGWLLMSLGMIRLAGYRLVRLPRNMPIGAPREKPAA